MILNFWKFNDNAFFIYNLDFLKIQRQCIFLIIYFSIHYFLIFFNDQQENYLYAMLIINLLILRYSAESNVLITSSQSFRFAFIFVFFRLYTTRHDHNDNRDDFPLKLIFLIINIVREKDECGRHNKLTYLNHDFAFIDSHVFFALRGLRHATRLNTKHTKQQNDVKNEES